MQRLMACELVMVVNVLVWVWDWTNECTLSFQSSSIDFLASQGFDFNKVFCYGEYCEIDGPRLGRFFLTWV